MQLYVKTADYIFYSLNGLPNVETEVLPLVQKGKMGSERKKNGQWLCQSDDISRELHLVLKKVPLNHALNQSLQPREREIDL